MHLAEKNAFRGWKENTFGLGGDPRLALLLIEERDRIRRHYYHPVVEHRKSLRFCRVAVKEKNQRIAREIRNTLRFHT